MRLRKAYPEHLQLESVKGVLGLTSHKITIEIPDGDYCLSYKAGEFPKICKLLVVLGDEYYCPFDNREDYYPLNQTVMKPLKESGVLKGDFCPSKAQIPKGGIDLFDYHLKRHVFDKNGYEITG